MRPLESTHHHVAIITVIAKRLPSLTVMPADDRRQGSIGLTRAESAVAAERAGLANDGSGLAAADAVRSSTAAASLPQHLAPTRITSRPLPLAHASGPVCAQAATVEAGLGCDGAPSTSAPSHHRGTLFSTCGTGVSVRVRVHSAALCPCCSMQGGLSFVMGSSLLHMPHR